MRLAPVYRMTFSYTQGWKATLAGLDGNESSYFYFGEGRCLGRVTGRFRGANHPRQRTDRTFLTDFQGVIETEDGAAIIVDIRGFGRAHPPGRRQVVAALRHMCGEEKYRWLNDTICVATGEVRSKPSDDDRVPLDRGAELAVDLHFEVHLDVAELVWEPLD